LQIEIRRSSTIVYKIFNVLSGFVVAGLLYLIQSLTIFVFSKCCTVQMTVNLSMSLSSFLI